MPWRLGEKGRKEGEGGGRGDRRRDSGRGRVFQTWMEEVGGRRWGHIRLRDLQWLYISQCLVKAARQGSGNLIIA